MWVADEGCGGFLGITPVARAKAHAGDVEVANFASGYGLEFVVEDQESFAITSDTDGDGRLGIGGANGDVIVAAGDGRLGGAVEIREAHIGEAFHPIDEGRGWQNFTAP